ncbi:MAG: FCD domain-containing protein [Clostridia bacterium]|nr:FCD domain-containing protein [Clostridia bacterium]
MVLRDFIRTCTPRDAEKVRMAYNRLEQLAAEADSFDVARFMEADLAMHEIWFASTGKSFLWRKLSAPESSYTRFCTLDVIEGKNTQDVLQEHREMLRMIDEHTTDGIEELMSRHLYGGVRRLRGLVYTKYADYFVPLEDTP